MSERLKPDDHPGVPERGSLTISAPSGTEFRGGSSVVCVAPGQNIDLLSSIGSGHQVAKVHVEPLGCMLPGSIVAFDSCWGDFNGEHFRQNPLKVWNRKELKIPGQGDDRKLKVVKRW